MLETKNEVPVPVVLQSSQYKNPDLKYDPVKEELKREEIIKKRVKIDRSYSDPEFQLVQLRRLQHKIMEIVPNKAEAKAVKVLPSISPKGLSWNVIAGGAARRYGQTIEPATPAELYERVVVLNTSSAEEDIYFETDNAPLLKDK